MPKRFDLTYTDAEGQTQTPVMIHRAILGSFERFMAILLEHYAGYLPLWLAPVQVSVLPISDEQKGYAEKVLADLKVANIRAEIDDRSESIGKKIRAAEMKKIPTMLIIGKREVAEDTVAVRSHTKGDEGAKSVASVIQELTIAINKRQ